MKPLSALVAVALLFAPLRLAGAPAPPSYGDVQARRGQTLYYENCAECHGDALQGNFGPALAVANGNLQWQTVSGVWQYMTAHMPAGNAGGLSQEEYVDVMAFLLKSRGWPPSAKPLTARAALESKAYLAAP